MASVFKNATQARKDARDSGAIHAEVRSLESSVLSSVEGGNLSVSVNSGTTMTTDTAYYNAYFSLAVDDTKLDQLTYVTRYFTDLGYGVTLTENATTQNTLVWNISW
jgi:hypothetical protein